VGVTKLKGDMDGKFDRDQTLVKLAEKIAGGVQELAAKPLTEREAARANAVLWCLFGGGGREMRFLTLAQLLPGQASSVPAPAPSTP